MEKKKSFSKNIFEDTNSVDVLEALDEKTGLNPLASDDIAQFSADEFVKPASITVKKGSNLIKSCEVDKDTVTIGRSFDNDIVLDGMKVSRSHAKIEQTSAGRFLITDLESTGGTKVNSKKVTSKEIFSGDVIKIGDYSLEFNSGKASQDRTMLDDQEVGVLHSKDEDKTQLGNVPAVTVRKANSVVGEYLIESDIITIGRKQENDIVLEGKNISRFHAKIERDGDRYRVVDLESTGGIKVNGKKDISTVLSSGDTIDIGSYKLSFMSDSADSDRTIVDSDDPENDETVFSLDEDGTELADDDRTRFYEEPLGKLIVERSRNLTGEISLDRDEILIGRDKDADLFIDDPRASKKHCRITSAGNRFDVCDMGSSNGTYVNGERITEKVLEKGDRIRIGDTLFRFSVDESVPVVMKERTWKWLKLTLVAFAIGLLAVAIYFLLPSFVNTPHEIFLQQLWKKSVSGFITGAPAIGDVNDDGYMDIVVGDGKGFITAMDGRTGGSIWNRPHNVHSAILAGLSLGDINEKDGVLDIIAATANGKIYAIDGSKNRLIWSNDSNTGNIKSTPKFADITSDGVLDVLIGSNSGYVYALDGKEGGTIWDFNFGGGARASIVLAQIDSDNIPDVIVSSQSDNVYALSGFSGSRIWSHHGKGPYSSAAIGMFDDDDISDLAIMSRNGLNVLNGKTGAMLWSAKPFSESTYQNIPLEEPTVGDLNDDGEVDFVVISNGTRIYVLDGKSRGGSYLWAFESENGAFTEPMLFDFNNDGILDVLTCSRAGTIYLLDGITGYVLNSYHLESEVRHSPAIADVNTNGKVDLVIGTVTGDVVVIETNTKAHKVWDWGI